jgi:hypothetical protein
MRKPSLVGHEGQLTSDFASRLLEAELELENTCCLVVLQELLDLYQDALEFYERNDDLRYLDFQKRIHSVLVKPEVLALLNAPQGIKRRDKSKSEKLQDKKAKLQRLKKTAALTASTLESGAKEHETVAEEAVAGVVLKTEETVQRTKEAVKLQQSNLEQRRLARRNKKHVSIDWTQQASLLNFAQLEESSAEKPQKINSGDSTRRNSIVAFNGDVVRAAVAAFESDKSAGHSILPVEIDELEVRLEELMERSFSAKSAKLTQIKERYEVEMKKTADQTGDSFLADLIVTQMKKLMNEELSTAAAEFDARRKQEIRSLRAQLT